MTLLEHLDEVNWKDLEHAYGSAEDVPGVIRNLLSDNPDERANAQDLLYIGPFHQGSVTTCLPYVVRFLVELLDNATTPDRPWIAQFLARTAQTCNHCADTDLRAIPPQVRLSIEQNPQPPDPAETQLCDELSKNDALFLRLLKSSEPDEIRIPLIALLIRLKCQHEELAVELAQSLKTETEQEVRAALVLGLGIMCRQLNTYVQTVQEIFQSDTESALVRLAAGIGLINGLYKETPEIVLVNVSNTIMDHPDDFLALDNLYHTLLTTPLVVWPHSDLLGVLKILGPDQVSIFFEALQRVKIYCEENASRQREYYNHFLKQLERQTRS